MGKKKSKLISWIITTVMITMILLTFNVNFSNATTLFSDDFESYTIGTFPSANWTNALGNGTWTVQSDGSKVFKQSNTSSVEYRVTAGSSWSNYTYEAKIKVTDSNFDSVSLLGRYVDGNNFYNLYLNPTSGGFALNKRVGGGWTSLASYSFTPSTNTWYTLKLELNGTSIKGYLDGVLRISVTDSSLSSGKIALSCWDAAEFDNVLVADFSGGGPTPTPTPTPTPSGTTVPIWGMFEGSVTNTISYSNPFTGTTLNVTYTAPTGGRQISFWGFYDGGTTWRFRFMPDEAGTWNYIATFSDGTPGANGSFTCTSTGARKGPVIVDSSNTHYYKYKGSGEHYIPRGYYYLDAFADYGGTWQSRIDSLVVNNGMNMVAPMTWVRGRTTTGEIGQSVDPIYAWQMNGSTVLWDKYDLTSWQKIDSVVSYCEARNLVVYVFDGFFPNIGTHVPSANEESYLRYALARLAPRWNLLWNIAFEWSEQYTSTQINNWGNLIQSLDPWDHLITSHGGNYTLYGFPTSAWSSYQSVQGEYKIPYPASQFMQDNYNQQSCYKPVFGCECLWESTGTGEKPKDGDEVRKGGWGLLLGGGNYLYADWTATWDGVNQNTCSYGNGQGWPYVKIMYNFLQSRSYWLMSPNNSLLTSNSGLADADKGVVLRQSGQEYIVYTPAGRTLALDLSETSNTFTVTWRNPRTDATQSGGTVNGGASRNFTTPDSNDWVLHLVKQ